MVSVRTLVLLYKGHLRARFFRELLALLGIAAGVALLFAVLVANKSVTASFKQLTEGVAGRASLEVAARSPDGFNVRLFDRVKRLPDVDSAAATVERRIAVKGPKGRRPLTLLGFDDRLTRLGGSLTKRSAHRSEEFEIGLYLPSHTAKAIGVSRANTVKVEVGERTERIPLAGILSSDELGPLTQSPIAIAHIAYAQELASMPNRLSRILVAPLPGHEKEARAALSRLSSDTLNVRESSTEATLLDEAVSSDRQSSALFSVISLVVGILLAYNAVLLSIIERRRDVAAAHSLGASEKVIFASIVFDALILGLAGSVLGIVLGDQLSRYVFHQVPGYLSSAFAIGNQRIVGVDTIVISIMGGTLAALAAAARPALELLKVGPTDSFQEKELEVAQIRSSNVHKRLLAGGIGLIAVFLALSLTMPETTLFGIAALVVGIIMILPSLITFLLSIALRLTRSTSSGAAHVAVSELATAPTRATALAAVGTLAVFSIVGITGTKDNLTTGVKQLAADIYGNADIWVSPGRDENPYLTKRFNQQEIVRRMRQLSAVESARVTRASFVDLNDKRLLVIGETGNSRHPIGPSQIIQGDLNLATRRFRVGRWAALTKKVADELNVEIGQEFSLPTPTGNRQFRLAATITNYGWPSGTLMVNSRDYERLWKVPEASVLQVDLANGVSIAAGKGAVEKAAGKSSSLKVQTADEAIAANAATTRQGLARINQISQIVLAAAVLAVVAAMLGSVWQRRQRFYGLVSIGAGSGQLYRTIFYEIGVILLLGCLIGAAFGFLLQAMGDRWVQLTTGYPVPFSLAWGLALQTIALITILAVLTVAIPVRLVFSLRRVAAAPSE